MPRVTELVGYVKVLLFTVSEFSGKVQQALTTDLLLTTGTAGSFYFEPGDFASTCQRRQLHPFNKHLNKGDNFVPTGRDPFG